MDIKGVLTEKLGPLPAWAWAGIGIGAYFLYTRLHKTNTNGVTLLPNASSIGTGNGYPLYTSSLPPATPPQNTGPPLPVTTPVKYLRSTVTGTPTPTLPQFPQIQIPVVNVPVDIPPGPTGSPPPTGGPPPPTGQNGASCGLGYASIFGIPFCVPVDQISQYMPGYPNGQAPYQVPTKASGNPYQSQASPNVQQQPQYSIVGGPGPGVLFQNGQWVKYA